jgi:hypothetical protein
MPTRKLKSKTRVGSKKIKTCDEPVSPFVRLVENSGLPQACKDTLNARCALYNPAGLQQNAGKAILRPCRRLAQSNRIQRQEKE